MQDDTLSPQAGLAEPAPRRGIAHALQGMQAIVLRGLQEELGLKLEAKKMPVDLVIIDRAEKVPVEN